MLITSILSLCSTTNRNTKISRSQKNSRLVVVIELFSTEKNDLGAWEFEVEENQRSSNEEGMESLEATSDSMMEDSTQTIDDFQLINEIKGREIVSITPSDSKGGMSETIQDCPLLEEMSTGEEKNWFDQIQQKERNENCKNKKINPQHSEEKEQISTECGGC